MTRQVVSFDEAGPDLKLFRNALGRFATGITVVTTRTPDGKREGMTANSFSAVSLDPPLVLWSVKNEAPSLPAFLTAGMFAVNVLSEEQAWLSHHFATPRAEKFDDVDSTDGHRGCPLIRDALARFECRLEQTVPAGDHQILIGRVLRASYDEAAAPLLFSGGRYAIAAPLPNIDATSDLAAMWEGLG
ncbi:flavin reductase family protein [Chelativorans sp. M5D2P16]|uniref:flavin reductase family protein n=1 Tax=Chelativorans sp. M5D2P16 TaxID=3095678 RepID=UPI002ACA09E9|nr:flavin reductase family protein [Chelativorans sp. M5D2P16]MDZ5696632.1 flavin reductase family protein [Chelativorans sp. M5D2P16]